jgi:PPM family protein phosphatase
MIGFTTASLSRAGTRDVNEDCADFLVMRDAACWVLADGLGGHRGGATASRTVVQAALRSFAADPEPSADAVRRHVTRGQAALRALQIEEPTLAQMRSTIVVLVATPRTCVWAHVGDSRLYQLREGRVVASTRDHAVSQMLVDGGEIAATEQRGHEDRARLLRCLGSDHADRDPGTTIGGPLALARGDAFLLCSDGFWEVLDDVALELDYAGAEDAEAWIERLDARLRRHLRPDHDNYTAMGIYVTDAPELDRQEHVGNDAITKPPMPRTRALRSPSLPSTRVRGHRHRRPKRMLAAFGVVALVLVALGSWKGDVLFAWVRAWLASPSTLNGRHGEDKTGKDETGPRDDQRQRAHP